MVFGDRPLVALDDSTFVSTSDYAQVKFPSDSTGGVARIEWGQGTWATTPDQAGPRFRKVRQR